MQQAELSLDRLERMLFDIQEEPDWRYEADREADYYDNNQLNSDTLEGMREAGVAPLVRNLIATAIDVVLGMEEKSRQDWKVLADEQDDTDEALALSKRLHEAERLSGADRACSDAYAHEIKVGVGWVEVMKNPDPFGFRHKLQSVHRREISWDWRATEPDLSDARYLVRKRWMDADVLRLHFPKHAKLIDQAVAGWSDWDSAIAAGFGIDLARGFDDYLRSSIEEMEWREVSGRKRLCLYEVWYRVYYRGWVLRDLTSGSVVEFEPGNERHENSVLWGLAQKESVVLNKVRVAYWVGPHRMGDQASPYTHNQFPYVPFWGLREDRTRIPYGLIRRMISAQDEVNARLSKMMWLLSSKWVMADTDAFAMSPQEVNDAAAAPNAVFFLNPDRKNRNQLPKVETDRDMSSLQFNVLQDAMKQVPELGGIYRPMVGKDSDVQSGVAINSLVEQGSITLAEINGNYRSSRSKVGELLLANEVQFQEGRPLEVSIKRGKEERRVMFNRSEPDEQGRTNALTLLKTRVELADVPSTPTYRAQQHTQLMELTKTLPDELKAVLIPMLVRGLDMADAREVAQLLESAISGGGEEEKSPVQLLDEQRQAAMAGQEQELSLRERAAKMEKDQAAAQKLLAEAQQVVEELRRAQDGMALQEAVREGEMVGV